MELETLPLNLCIGKGKGLWEVTTYLLHFALRALDSFFNYRFVAPADFNDLQTAINFFWIADALVSDSSQIYFIFCALRPSTLVTQLPFEFRLVFNKKRLSKRWHTTLHEMSPLINLWQSLVRAHVTAELSIWKSLHLISLPRTVFSHSFLQRDKIFWNLVLSISISFPESPHPFLASSICFRDCCNFSIL